MILVLFYGPGGGEYEDWQAFNMHINTERALAAGVPEDKVRNFLLLNVGEHGRLNFQGLGRAYADRQVKRRIRAYAAIITLQYGIPFMTRQLAFYRYSTVYKPLDMAVAPALRRATAKEAAETAVYRLLMRRAPTRLLSRVVPYVGWGLAGYDIYTIIFKGQLWGVQIYEKA